MKICCLVFLPVLLSMHSIAQGDYFFVGHSSGSPLLYSVKKSVQQYPQALKTSTAWNALTGNSHQPNEADLKKAAPQYYRYFPPNDRVGIGKNNFLRICMMGDSLLAADDKGKVFFVTSQNGAYVKGEQIPVITEARNNEIKAEQKFLIEYDPFNRAIYFLHNGSLCRVPLSGLTTEEEVVKPVGGLRIIAFTLLSGGRKAMLKFIPSNIMWNRFSSATLSEIFRVFDLSNGRPLAGLNYKNGMNAVISADGNWILTAGYEGGWLYDVEKGRELHTYGPVLFQRINSYSWTSIIDDHYLYVLPAANDKNTALFPYLKVYDLLDSLKPVNIFTFNNNPLLSLSSSVREMKASGPPKKLPASTSLKQVMESLQPLTLPVAFNSFYKPAPGTEVPSTCWRPLGFQIQNMNTGTSLEPTIADSAEGRFQVYVLGQLSVSAAGKSFVVASHHFHYRNPNFSDNEMSSSLSYWLCTYDNKTGLVTRQRMLTGDDKLFVNDAWYFPQNRTEIIKLGANELYFYVSKGENFYLNTETLVIRK